MELEVGGCGDRHVCLDMGDNESDSGDSDYDLLRCLEWLLIIFLAILAIVLLVKSGQAIILYDKLVTAIGNFFQSIADGVKSAKPASSVTALRDQ